MKISLTVILLLAFGFGLKAQKVNDSNTPLHLMKPDYDTPTVTDPLFWLEQK